MMAMGKTMLGGFSGSITLLRLLDMVGLYSGLEMAQRTLKARRALRSIVRQTEPGENFS